MEINYKECLISAGAEINGFNAYGKLSWQWIAFVEFKGHKGIVCGSEKHEAIHLSNLINDNILSESDKIAIGLFYLMADGEPGLYDQQYILQRLNKTNKEITNLLWCLCQFENCNWITNK